MTKRIAAVVLFVLVAIAAVAPIRSYDYFWHLAAGRWIVDHHAIPATDPLAVASVRTPWINGEWLYQVVLYATHVNDQATSLLNALLIAAIFTCGFVLAARQNDWALAVLAAAVAFAGASDRLGVRSEEHTSELQSLTNLVCRLLLEKKNLSVILCARRKSNSGPATRYKPSLVVIQ